MLTGSYYFLFFVKQIRVFVSHFPLAHSVRPQKLKPWSRKGFSNQMP